MTLPLLAAIRCRPSVLRLLSTSRCSSVIAITSFLHDVVAIKQQGVGGGLAYNAAGKNCSKTHPAFRWPDLQFVSHLGNKSTGARHP